MGNVAPFTKPVLEYIDTIEDFFLDLGNDFQELKNDILGVTAEGTCWLENDDMVGFFEGGGFPR